MRYSKILDETIKNIVPSSRERMVEKEKENLKRKNTKKIEETESSMKKNFVLILEKTIKRKRKIRNRKINLQKK